VPAVANVCSEEGIMYSLRLALFSLALAILTSLAFSQSSKPITGDTLSFPAGLRDGASSLRYTNNPTGAKDRADHLRQQVSTAEKARTFSPEMYEKEVRCRYRLMAGYPDGPPDAAVP
jgi:hypothetical protein